MLKHSTMILEYIYNRLEWRTGPVGRRSGFGEINDGGLRVVYRQEIYTIFRMPIYPMLNQRNANPITPNPGL